ncbi:hypothetical protein ACFW5X_05845 [Streptomyces albogriseolus]
MRNGTNLYALDISGASLTPGSVRTPFTTEELDAAGIDPARFGLGA